MTRRVVNLPAAVNPAATRAPSDALLLARMRAAYDAAEAAEAAHTVATETADGVVCVDARDTFADAMASVATPESAAERLARKTAAPVVAPRRLPLSTDAEHRREPGKAAPVPANVRERIAAHRARIALEANATGRTSGWSRGVVRER